MIGKNREKISGYVERKRKMGGEREEDIVIERVREKKRDRNRKRSRAL